MTTDWKRVLFNTCIALNCLLIFLVVFGSEMQLPLWLQVTGRFHPLAVHFPIVLMLVAFVWELFFTRKDYAILREAGDWFLLGSAFTGVLAALMGLFLSREVGYDQDAIVYHKWTGVGSAVISLIWYASRSSIRKRKLSTTFAGLIAMGGVAVAGHLGANITHGSDFLFAPVMASNHPKVLLEDAIAYTHLIKPILEDKCVSCHNNRKAKGELIMETEALLLKGGKNGRLWDSTAKDFGLMMQRIHLPLDAKEHMPPKGKAQLTEEEEKAIYYWIKGGASFTQRIIDLPETDTLRMIAAGFFTTAEQDSYSFEPAKESLIKELNTDYRVVNPLALGSPALNVEFFGPVFFKPEQLKELEKVKTQVVSLNLAKMPVTDADLKLIGNFTNLRKLNLSFTKITGAGLSALSGLKDLRQLSLSGTAVKPADIAQLKGLEKLATIYAWNTGVQEKDLDLLAKQFPDTRIEMGFKGDTIKVKLNPPIIEGEQQVLTGPTTIILKHYVNGVQLRYTLDGKEPDSINSPLYKDGILINGTGVLKAKAFLPGWYSSEVASKNYYKTGFRPDSVSLVAKPAASYAGSGGKTLADGEKGDLNFRTEKWLGYKDNDMVALLYFNQPAELSGISVSTIVDIGNYIMPAQQLEVWGGANASGLKLLGRLNPVQPKEQVPGYMVGFDFAFAKQKISVLKLVARPVTKLPPWHRGKGERGWVFIDEVFIN
ncbi:chitobiase/beta-hexosaminidase C-terminal domain-containing protein [Flavihumibacter rivuli]|uniref:DUF2231 domain-containing protein n=1 Tax=Flavihumibacter rivuli TaxID=2838156 RepID=UPI001BDDEDFC|nr:DUF2231 domain-containing protein [Flavihumibacter rivuli]ULQ56981.1 chitobiase/beta-hexosaminidase C-terminal domain-containing protein [Flavihumibacter rivuli]